jgi:cell division protein FtsL
VTLSFAVVQKNLQTDAVVHEYRQLDAQNARLAEEAAGLSSSLKVRSIGVKKYHLVVPSSVQYVTAKSASGAKAKRAGD